MKCIYKNLHTEMQQWTVQKCPTDSAAWGQGFHCCQWELSWDSEAEYFYYKDVWLFFVVVIVVVLISLLQTYFINVPCWVYLHNLSLETFFSLKTVPCFDSDCELLWKDFVKCSVSLLQQASPTLGVCRVLSLWLVICHNQNLSRIFGWHIEGQG